jgi:hypothetical protein
VPLSRVPFASANSTRGNSSTPLWAELPPRRPSLGPYLSPNKKPQPQSGARSAVMKTGLTSADVPRIAHGNESSPHRRSGSGACCIRLAMQAGVLWGATGSPPLFAADAPSRANGTAAPSCRLAWDRVHLKSWHTRWRPPRSSTLRLLTSDRVASIVTKARPRP